MTAIQKISQEAKRIYKANPQLTWRECIKKASLLYTKKKKNAIVKKVISIPAKAKKVAIKKAKAGAKSIIKKIYESKILNGTKAVAKKKPIAKKTPAKSYHKDTKSHNVNIRVMSGIKKDDLIKLTKIIKEIEFQENTIKNWQKNKKELVKKEGLKSYNINLKLLKNRLMILKRHQTELKKLL